MIRRATILAVAFLGGTVAIAQDRHPLVIAGIVLAGAIAYGAVERRWR